MSGATTTYTLKHPLKLRDKDGTETGHVTDLTLRRLNGRDMEALDQAKGPGSSLIVLIARSADLAPAVVRLMDGEDITDAGAIVAGFLGGATPETSDD